MMLLTALIVLFVSLLFLIFESLRAEQRRKKVEDYIGGQTLNSSFSLLIAFLFGLVKSTDMSSSRSLSKQVITTLSGQDFTSQPS